MANKIFLFVLLFIALAVLPSMAVAASCSADSLIGDVNGDGSITTDDATLINNIYIDSKLAPAVICCADVNMDGSIKPTDALMVNRYVMGLYTGNISKKCSEVYPSPASLQISSSFPVLSVGDSLDLSSSKIIYSNGNEVAITPSISGITWSVANPSIASVEASGGKYFLEALSPGTTSVYATYDYNYLGTDGTLTSPSTTFTVASPPASADACMMSAVPSNYHPHISGTLDLQVACSKNGNEVPCPELAWGTSNDIPGANIGEVALTSGDSNTLTTERYAASGNVVVNSGTTPSFTCSHKVIIAYPEHIYISKGLPTLTAGQTIQLSGSVVYSNGDEVEISSSIPGLTWTSDNTAIGTFDANGKFTAKKAGTTTVHADYAYFTSPTNPAYTSSDTTSITVTGATPSTATKCALQAPDGVITTNQKASFSIQCLDASNKQVACPDGFEWSNSKGYYMPDNTGETATMLTGINSNVGTSAPDTIKADNGAISCTNTIQINDIEGTPKMYVSPKSATVGVKSHQDFTVTIKDSEGHALVPQRVAGELDDGTIGTFDAGAVGEGIVTFTAKKVGDTTLALRYQYGVGKGEVLEVEIPIKVTSSSSGGSGGSGGGSSTYRTSSKISYSCAGKPGSINVTFLDKTTKSALLTIDFGGKTVFSKNITSSGSYAFTPQESGAYEAHVIVGADQETETFSVLSCVEGQNATQNGSVVINLQPTRKLVLSKLVDYGNGFTKDFKVYEITSGSNVTYESYITLYYANSGNNTIYNATIEDGIPKNVVSDKGKVSFDHYPDEFPSSSVLLFNWNGESVKAGGKVSYFYSIGKGLNEASIAAFPKPAIVTTEQRSSVLYGVDQAFAGLAASLGTMDSNSASLIAIVGAAVIVLVGIAAFMLFVMGKKKEEY
jgi:hypothetical protein